MKVFNILLIGAVFAAVHQHNQHIEIRQEKSILSSNGDSKSYSSSQETSSISYTTGSSSGHSSSTLSTSRISGSQSYTSTTSYSHDIYTKPSSTASSDSIASFTGTTTLLSSTTFATSKLAASESLVNTANLDHLITSTYQVYQTSAATPLRDQKVSRLSPQHRTAIIAVVVTLAVLILLAGTVLIVRKVIAKDVRKEVDEPEEYNSKPNHHPYQTQNPSTNF